MGWVFMDFGNLGSYKNLNTYMCFFAYLFAIFEILDNPPILISSYFKMSFEATKYVHFTPWLMYLLVSALYLVLF